jgi:cerevisin
MSSFISFTAFAAALSLTFANVAPTSARHLRDRDFVENSYIVKLKVSANTTSHIDSLPFPFSVEDANSPITHWWPDDFFKGYCGNFVGAALDAILASPDVEYVEKNAIVRHMPLSFTSDILNR